MWVLTQVLTQNIYPNHRNRHKLIKEVETSTITIPNHDQVDQWSIFSIVEVSFDINNKLKIYRENLDAEDTVMLTVNIGRLSSLSVLKLIQPIRAQDGLKA